MTHFIYKQFHNEFFFKAFSFTLNFFSLGDAYKNVFFQNKDFLNKIIAKYDKVRMTHGNNIPKHIKLKMI